MHSSLTRAYMEKKTGVPIESTKPAVISVTETVALIIIIITIIFI